MAVMAKNKRSVCKSCAHKGHKHYLFGKSLKNDVKQKMSISKKGKVLTESHKLKLSISQKRRYLNPQESRITSEKVKIAMHQDYIRKNTLKL